MSYIQGRALPQVRPSLVHFLIAGAPNSKRAQKMLSLMQSQADDLRQLGEKCKNTIESDFIGSRERSSMSFGELADPVPHVLWALEKYGRISRKYKKLRCDKYVEKIEQICEIVAFLHATIKLKLPFIFHYDKFIEQLAMDGDEELAALEYKLLAMKNFILSSTARRHPVVSQQELIQCLKRNAGSADRQLEYAHVNEFDSVFFDFLVCSGKISAFEKMAADVPVFDNKRLGQDDPPLFDFSRMEQQIRSVVMDLGLKGQISLPEYYVLRSATIRVLFDLYYSMGKAPGFAVPPSADFVLNAEAYLALTPRQHNMNATIIHESLYDETLKAITRGTGFYEKAVARMILAFLQTNPLDMAFAIHKVMNCVVKAVNVFALVKPKRGGDDLGFDDYFSFYVPVCAMTPFLNHESLRNFVSAFKNLKLSSTLDYSRVTMVASVDQITDFVPPDVL